MTTLLVSRHRGACDWLSAQGIAIDRQVSHLDMSLIRSGDTVLGTLPVHLAAKVCACGARYFHLSIDLPPELRGMELSDEQLSSCGARLEAFDIKPSNVSLFPEEPYD